MPSAPAGGGPRGASADRPTRAGDSPVEVLAATDVDNPLLGPTGAAAVYGPQKGAGPGDVGPVDAALANFADRVETALGRELRSVPGAGAAGGLGFGLLAFCGASIVRGIEVALDLVGFDAALAAADLVITGEGRIDPQTLHGKVVAGVAGRARAAGVPAYAIGGAVDPAVRTSGRASRRPAWPGSSRRWSAPLAARRGARPRRAPAPAWPPPPSGWSARVAVERR